MLQVSNRIVALTGAGISTRSGIPDFRSPHSGVWDQVDPLQVASIYAFQQDPQPFYNWIRPLTNLILQAQPNPAHIALAQMEQAGRLTAVITQNIDMLHSKAGSQTIYELHGHLRTATCLNCHQTTPSHNLLAALSTTGDLPFCPHCGHILKPDIILFGELLPLSILHKAQHEAKQCDAMIVAGSALEVSPANELPWLAKQSGAYLIFVNLTTTHLDPIADVVIHADVADVLPQLAQALTNNGVPQPHE